MEPWVGPGLTPMLPLRRELRGLDFGGPWRAFFVTSRQQCDSNFAGAGIRVYPGLCRH